MASAYPIPLETLAREAAFKLKRSTEYRTSASILLAECRQAERPVGRRAPHLDTCTALLARGATLGELMEGTGGTEPMVRRWIDQVRKRGHTVRRTGPKAWVINGC